MMMPTAGRRGRWRRRIGAVVLLIGVLLSAGFIVSAWWWAGYCSSTWLADVGDGTLYVNEVESGGWSELLLGWNGGPNEQWTGGNTRRSWTWTWWKWGPDDLSWSKRRAYTIWPAGPLLIVAGSAMLLPGLIAARRSRRGQCERCGYSLAGLAGGAACPECGTATGLAH